MTRPFCSSLLDVKNSRKTELKDYLAKTQGIELDDNSIYDIQIKRLHEYKRQQMNALYVIHKYFEIKAGKKPTRPITVIFGAKAAPAYVIAKDIIHLILCLSELIAKDPEVSPYLKVVMVENYNVTLAEKLIPACRYLMSRSPLLPRRHPEHRQHEVHVKRCGSDRNHGRCKRGDASVCRRRQHLHLR